MTYCNKVLTGNWSEERLQENYEFKLFLKKRERNELLTQRSRLLFTNLLKEKPLKLCGTDLLYGYNVQIIASDMPAKKTVSGATQYGLALSVLVDSLQVDYMYNMKDGCLLTLSPITNPCCRNTFIVVHPIDETIEGEKVYYGDEFLLRAENIDPEEKPLYVRFNPATAPSPADRMPLRLSTTKDSNCRWTTSALFAKEHLELVGTPVKCGRKLLLKNCVADTHLSVMNQNWMQTFFGPECGVNCRNCIDKFKRYTAENVMTLVSDVATKKQNK